MQEELRYALNWREYIQHLEDQGLKIDLQERAFFSRYEKIRLEEDFFLTFFEFQNEIRQMLDVISKEREIPLTVWESIFREAEKVREVVRPHPAPVRSIGPEDLNELDFRKQVAAETYRSFLLGELRSLIVGRRIFRCRKCPECNRYFYDNTKNGNKVYCRSQTCGNRAKQRNFQKRRNSDRLQGSLDFYLDGDGQG